MENINFLYVVFYSHQPGFRISRDEKESSGCGYIFMVLLYGDNRLAPELRRSAGRYGG
jgi:hypothetical protein